MNRREFLRLHSATAALVAGASLSVSCGARSSRPRKDVRLSASSMLYKDLTLEQALGRISGVGYQAVDIWGPTEGCLHLDDAVRRLGGAGLKQLLSSHRLKLSAVTLLDGGFDKYADFLGEIGGTVVIQGSAPRVRPEELSQRMRSFVEGLKPAADRAAAQGSHLAIVNQSDALLSSFDSIKAFVDLNQHPNVGIAIAPFHLQALGISVPDVVQTAGQQVLFFYAWQNDIGLKQLPGYGPVDFRPWLDALKAVHYKGYVNPFVRGYIEPDLMSASLARARNYLLHPA